MAQSQEQGPANGDNFGERAAGKTADVLAARAEPLLSDGGDEFAVAQHARGGIGMKGVETDD